MAEIKQWSKIIKGMAIYGFPRNQGINLMKQGQGAKKRIDYK